MTNEAQRGPAPPGGAPTGEAPSGGAPPGGAPPGGAPPGGGAAVAVLPGPGLRLAGSTPDLLVQVRALAERLSGEGGGPLSQDERTALIAELETLKNICAGAQAAATLDLHEQAALDREATKGEMGHRRREREGVTLEVALARQVSPQRSRSLIAMTQALHDRLPHTLEAFRAGRVSEWAATLVVKETKELTDEQARCVDEGLAATLGTCSEGRLQKRAAALAYEADKRGFVTRHAKAVEDRFVAIRPVADGMVRLTALLPLTEGIAVKKALTDHATAARASGDERTKAQLCADELVRRITGVDPATQGIPVEIGLVMSDRALLGDGEDAARVPGFGPVPAALARMIAALGSTRGGEVSAARAWIRRLVLDPIDSTLADLDKGRRVFTGPLRRFVLTRDQECAMPYCTAPIQDVDHVDRARDGGGTTGSNGQGLCQACNLDKEAEDLSTEVITAADGSRAVRVRTRYGQTAYSQPPPLLDSLADLRARAYGERSPWWQQTSRSGHGSSSSQQHTSSSQHASAPWLHMSSLAWDGHVESWGEFADLMDEAMAGEDEAC